VSGEQQDAKPTLYVSPPDRVSTSTLLCDDLSQLDTDADSLLSLDSPLVADLSLDTECLVTHGQAAAKISSETSISKNLARIGCHGWSTPTENILKIYMQKHLTYLSVRNLGIHVIEKSVILGNLSRQRQCGIR